MFYMQIGKYIQREMSIKTMTRGIIFYSTVTKDIV